MTCKANTHNKICDFAFGIVPNKAESKFPDKIPKPAKIKAVPAKEKATGNPANKTKQTTKNINKGMNSTIIYFDNIFKNFRKTL